MLFRTFVSRVYSLCGFGVFGCLKVASLSTMEVVTLPRAVRSTCPADLSHEAEHTLSPRIPPCTGAAPSLVDLNGMVGLVSSTTCSMPLAISHFRARLVVSSNFSAPPPPTASRAEVGGGARQENLRGALVRGRGRGR